MADTTIKQITVEDGGTYDLEDQDARGRIDDIEEGILNLISVSDETLVIKNK